MAIQDKLTSGLPSHIHFSGDVHPLDHGGKWLDVRQWSGAMRSAEAVAFEPLEDYARPWGIEAVRVNVGTVTADDKRLAAAAEMYGMKIDAMDAETQAEACMSYAGMAEYGYEPRVIAWRDMDDLKPEEEEKIKKWCDARGLTLHAEKEDAVTEALNAILSALPV
jgi:hypothetical protein